MTNDRRYASLRDYVTLLRRQWWVIAAVTIVFAAAGLALALSQSKSYTSEADVTFRDISQDLRLIGQDTPAANTPAELASNGARGVTRLPIAKRVQRRLKSEGLSVRELQGAVTARVAALTDVVVIQATWTDPVVAARIANAFADEDVRYARRQLRSQIDDAIKNVKDQLGKNPPTVPTAPADSLAQQELLTLRTLKNIARPAQVTSPAQPSAAPSSPSPARNLVLGGLVGLAFGLLAAFGRDSLDRKIRAPGDAHRELGYPVLGRIGASALGSAGLAGNGRGYLTDADLESFRVLRTNLAFFGGERRVRSVLVTSGLPQEGKTTVAASLATATAFAGQRTLLVDGDLRRPAIATRLGISASPGLADYLGGSAKPQDVLQTHELGMGRNGIPDDAAREGAAAAATLVCIASGRPPNQPAELLASDRCRDFLETVAKAYDLVVIDSSPMLSAVDPLELIPYVDAVVVCVRLSSSTRDEARAVKGALGRLPERPTGLVITGLTKNQEDYGYYGYATAG
jgi:succinoglycan biosynthesis transport protein ExoP